MKIFVELTVPDNFGTLLDQQRIIEQEIGEDRWAWHKDMKSKDRMDDAYIKAESMKSCYWVKDKDGGYFDVVSFTHAMRGQL